MRKSGSIDYSISKVEEEARISNSLVDEIIKDEEMAREIKETVNYILRPEY